MATFKPIVMSGPSGSGKSTLLKRLMAEFEGCFAFSISHTTRKPRPGEHNGREYHFVSREEMLAAIGRNEFIETAEFSGNMYGTSIKAVQDVVSTGKICILDIDMQGVKSIKDTKLDPIYVFVRPPSFEILEKRLVSRGTENEQSLKLRLDTAKEELAYASTEGAYDHIIMNDNLDTAYQAYRNIFMPAIHQLKAQNGTTPDVKNGVANGISNGVGNGSAITASS